MAAGQRPTRCKRRPMPRSLRTVPLASASHAAEFAQAHRSRSTGNWGTVDIQQGELPRWHERTGMARLQQEMLSTFERVLVRAAARARAPCRSRHAHGRWSSLLSAHRV
eukprot:COSAG05_NODE_160_length_15590_cov_14.460848_16_plen_109_part_00